MRTPNIIIEEYLKSEGLYSSFCKKTSELMKNLVEINNIIPHQITSRVKDSERLYEKIERKKDKYSNLSDITDLVGIRIITYFEDDVDKIAKIIENEFKIDTENSIDKRILETDKFGYRSLHYVISLDTERTKLSEYKKFKPLKAEIQIRSILQHAWAEIEHDIGYKGEIEIPDFAKRRFNRIAALLEMADIEFVQLRESLDNYENTLPNELESNPESVMLDKASLTSFINSSKTLESINKEIVEKFEVTLNNNMDGIDDYLPRMEYFEIKTIKQLDDELKRFEHKFVPYIKMFTKNPIKSDIKVVPKGWPIFYLGYILASENNDSEKALDFVKKIFPSRENPHRLVTKMLDAQIIISKPQIGKNLK